MKRRKRFLGGTNNGFVCENCGCKVRPLTKGGYRNHCPHCLYSKHVDINPGDRASECGGLMEPVGVFLTGKKGGLLPTDAQNADLSTEIKRH